MAWTAPRTWVAGETVTAAIMNTHVRDNLKAIGDPWTAYTPTFAGGFSAIGNAVVAAKHLLAGKLAIGEVKVTMGSTTTFAAGNLSVSMPVATATTPNFALGSAFFFDNSGNVAHPGSVISATSTTFAFVDPAGFVSNTVPWTWAVSDILTFAFAYEAA